MQKYYLFLTNVKFLFGIYTSKTISSTVQFIKYIYTIKFSIVLNLFPVLQLFLHNLSTSNLKMELQFSDYLVVI